MFLTSLEGRARFFTYTLFVRHVYNFLFLLVATAAYGHGWFLSSSISPRYGGADMTGDWGPVAKISSVL